nr:hypothetical protein PPOKNCAL_00133 [Escherichia coli]
MTRALSDNKSLSINWNRQRLTYRKVYVPLIGGYQFY